MENSYYQKSTLVNRVLVAVVTQLFVVVAEIPISRNESNQNIFQLYYASKRWLWWGNILSMSNGRSFDNLWTTYNVEIRRFLPWTHFGWARSILPFTFGKERLPDHLWKKKNNPNFQTPTMGLGMMAHIWPNMPKVGQFETSMALIFISNMTPMLKKTSLANQQI